MVKQWKLRQGRIVTSVLLGVLLTASISAEELTRQKQGRVAVSQCYAACIDGWYETWIETSDSTEWAIDIIVSDDFAYLSISDQIEFVQASRLQICLNLNVAVRRIDACRAGCIDVQQSYGEVPTSYIKNRFSRTYTTVRDNVRRLGLWDDWNRDVNVEAACERAYELLSSEYEYRSGATSKGDATYGNIESLLTHPMLMRLPEREWRE